MFRRRADTAAAAICWSVCRVNDVLDQGWGGFTQKALLAHVGLQNGSVSQRAGTLLDAGRLPPPPQRLRPGSTDYLVSTRRHDILDKRARFSDHERARRSCVAWASKPATSNTESRTVRIVGDEPRNFSSCTVCFALAFPYNFGAGVPGRPRREQVYHRLDEAIVDLRDRMGGLPDPIEAEDIWTAIWYQEAHNSTAIEGNTLVLRQVEFLLRDGRAVGDKELREYMEVKGYADAARWVYGHALQPGAWTDGSLITLTEVRHIHKMALGPAWDVAPHPNATDKEAPGSFREHDIAPFPGGMKPPSWTEVTATMRDWTRGVVKLRDVERPIEGLAATHSEFERIHPFLDGNGRTGRLLLNLLLLRLGYAPAIIYLRDRARYLRALRAADGGDTGPLGELLARAVLDNLYRFVVPAVAGPKRLVPLTALTDKDLTEGALRVAANRGRLRAQKGDDGQWRSTRAWVEEYKSQRHQRQA